jgi:hypothetical protein
VSRALAGVLVLAAALLLAGVAAARVVKSRAADTTRSVRSVTITDQGVRIDGVGGGEEPDQVDVNIGDVVRIHAHGDSGSGVRRVRIGGPVVVVDNGSSGMVRLFADAEVPAGERIEGDVVAVFGSVLVKGHIAGNAVAVFGSVSLAPNAQVDGDVVAIGGGLDQAPGAVVNGESVSLGLFSWWPGVPTLPMLLLGVFGAWFLSLLVAGLLTLVFPDRMARIATTASQRTAGSFVLGVASAPLFVIALVLLLITVVGIPFALLLPLVYCLAIWAGQIAATQVLGCRLLRRRLGERGPMGPIAVGSLFVAVFFVLGAILAGPPGASRTLALFFTLLGTLLVLGLSLIGTGAVLLSRFGSRPREGEVEAPGTAVVSQPTVAQPPALGS